MRFRLRTILILFAVIAATLVGIRSCMDWLDPFAGRSFDGEVWHQFHNNDDPNNPRASMVASLRRWYLKPGMTHEQVVELLGEPDMDKRPDMYEYNLGMWSGFRIDYDGLQIHFDDQGRGLLERVREYRKTTHVVLTSHGSTLAKQIRAAR